MKKFWEWLKSIVLQISNKVREDVFLAAYIKIIGFYILVSILIAALAEYILYGHAATFAKLFTDSVGAEIQWINIGIALWILFTVSGCAYFLAKITLFPIRQAMERQRRFIANIAHELRTPLSVMKTNFEVALLDVDKTSREEFVAAIMDGIEEVDRITEITHFLMNSSSLEKRGAQFDFSDIDLSRVANATIKFMEPILVGKQVAMKLVCDDSVFIRGNATAIQAMLINLLKNAIAYTPAGGSVVVRVVHKPYGFATLSVEDTGIGIPSKDLPKIFEPFYRGENAVSQRSKKRGSGIGLAIVKEIVELHDAHILVKSEVGEGTAISVQFLALQNRT